jgi:hypothetical protein
MSERCGCKLIARIYAAGPPEPVDAGVCGILSGADVVA